MDTIPAPDLRDMDVEMLVKLYPPYEDPVPEGPAAPLPDGVSDIRDLDVETLTTLYPPKTGPIPDSIIQLLPFALFLVPFTRSFKIVDPDAIVLGNRWIYYRDERGSISRVAPDTYVSFNAGIDDLKDDRSYFVERVGKPPEFVMEIGSKSTSDIALYQKPRIYALIGIPEYWMVDPEGGVNYGFPLKGLRLVNGEYEPIEMTNLPNGAVSGYSEALGLTLLWDGNELRFIDPLSGRPLRTSAELEADERAAQRAALASRQEASEERRRREAIQAELDELRQMLGER